MGIRSRMIVLISALVALSAVLPAAVSLLRVRQILRTKTFEICRNLGNHISNVAREELLLDETYDATHDALGRLSTSQESSDRIPGLLKFYVVNFDGVLVAANDDATLGEQIPESELAYFRSLSSLTLSEGTMVGGAAVGALTPTLRFSYPVFVRAFNGDQMRVGTTVFVFDRDEVYRPVQDLTVFVVLVTVVLLILGLVVAIATALYFARPIKVLTDGVNRIGGGDLKHRITVSRSDELGDLALNFNRMTAQIEDFTGNLERKVEERTEQLNRSLADVKALKEQQDGDYFLTSLLLNPFRRNQNNSINTETDFIVDQKKKFQFRDWTAEIGGDYCVTDTIRIGAQDYTVFLNADAMGKSIQGAGGALVLATVFQGFLARLSDERLAPRRPELWLRDCYLALQSVFATFQGTMFITLILGLADESGAVYFVNAEHPSTVLYRSGKATYIEQDLWLRKLGTIGEERNFKIRMLQLKPEDVLLIGSDGKDDIVPNADGAAFVSGGDWFLRHVEAARGDLQRILDSIKQHGEIKDDVSLLRLAYFPEESGPELQDRELRLYAALKKSGRSPLAAAGRLVAASVEGRLPDNLSELALLSARACEEAGRLRDARALYVAYLENRPHESGVFLPLARLSFRLKEYDQAQDFGECLRLRQPENEEVVILLGETHLKRGNLPRARLSLERGIALAPDHPGLKKLYRAVRKQGGVAADEPKEIVDAAEIEKLRANAERQYRDENYLPAAAVCRQILALSPDDQHALGRMADSFLRAGEVQRAIPLYNRVIFTAPKDASARNNVAVGYAALGQVERALQQLERALVLEPSNGQISANAEALAAYIEKNNGDSKREHAPALSFVEEQLQSAEGGR